MRVLMVEDDMVVAGGLGPAVAEAGHDLVGLAADGGAAVALLRSTEVDLALVDLRLADGWTGMDVARAAAENGVATLFATGNRKLLPDDLAGAQGLIEKPYSAACLKATLRFLAARLAGDQTGAPPRCLVLPVRPTRQKAASEPRGDVASTAPR